MKLDKKIFKIEIPFKDRLKYFIMDSKDLFFKHIILFTLILMTISCVFLGGVVYLAEKDAQGANITSYWEGIWWSVVTALTVGYGDRYPITPSGRVPAMLLMFIGVALMGVITAKISSIFLERALLDRRGFVDERHLHDHLIICGWKKEMYELVIHVLDSSDDLPPERLVLCNNVPDEVIDRLLSNERTKNIKVVKGDFFNKPVLERAAPQRARKIVILADATPNEKGQIPTVTEADARTVMTAMTLSNIAKGVPIVAEILDASMDQYLKLAHVNEIVYSRDYSRLILAKATHGTGIPNIFQQLLNPDSHYRLTTRVLPDGFVTKTYKDLKNSFDENFPGVVLLGILENSGNSHTIKEAALKKAQKTPDIKQLVENLQIVKGLRFNNPVFAPKAEYQIPEGCLAIVIEPVSGEEMPHGLAA